MRRNAVPMYIEVTCKKPAQLTTPTKLQKVINAKGTAQFKTPDNWKELKTFELSGNHYSIRA